MRPRSPAGHARRELVGVNAPDPEALDHPVANREGREERDLLRRDGADDRLVRVWRERRPEPGEPRHELAQDLVALRPRVEGVELEVGADDGARDRLGLVVQRLHVDARGGACRRRIRGRPVHPGGRLLPRGFDSDLAPADDAGDAALVPEVSEIRPEGSDPYDFELSTERFRAFGPDLANLWKRP